MPVQEILCLPTHQLFEAQGLILKLIYLIFFVILRPQILPSGLPVKDLQDHMWILKCKYKQHSLFKIHKDNWVKLL